MKQMFGKLKKCFLGEDGSWGWCLRILILGAALLMAWCFTWYLSDEIIKILLSRHFEEVVDDDRYRKIITESSVFVFVSAVTLGLFGLITGLGNWVIKNHDVKKAAKDRFNEENELLFSNAVRALSEKPTPGKDFMNAHGLRELARIKQEGFIVEERIDALTRSGLDLQKVDLKNAVLAGLDLSYAQLSEALFTEADLSKTFLVHAKLSGSDLSKAKLISARLMNADLRGAQLPEARLLRANLREAVLTGANLSGADLSEADLFQADLSGADLSKTSLPGVKLAGGNLSQAKLVEADLFGGNLSQADLSGADLRGADLDEADLQEAIYDEHTKFSPEYDPAAHGLKRI